MITTQIPPSTPDLAAAIMAALQIGDVELAAGEYILDAPIDIPSGRVIGARGFQAARLIGGWEQAANAWDDPRNALLRAEGHVDLLGASTVTTAVAAKDATELLVEDDTGIAAGSWLRVVSGGGPGDQLQQTDSPLLEFVDLVQVAVDYAGGLVVPLRRPLAMHHIAGATVTSWLPVRDVRIEGVELVAGGASVGILAADALGIDLRNVRGAGFSRALVNARAVRGLELHRLRGLGANNSLLFLESCAIVRVLDVSNDEDGACYAPTGIPRGLITIRRRCTGLDLDQIHLVHGCIGVQVWGGQGIRFGSISARDMCPDMARERDHDLLGDHELGGGCVGAALDMGTNVVSAPSASEFAYSVAIGSLYAENCHGAHQADVAAYVHDVLDVSIGSIVINNKGVSAHTPGAPARRGVVFSDSQGYVASVRCTGVDEPLRLRGYWTPSIGHYHFEGAPGVPYGVASGPSVLFEAGSPGAIGVIDVHNASNVAFAAQFQGAPDFGLEIGAYQLEWFGAHGVTLADGGSTPFNVGDIAAIDPASPPGRRHITPSFEGASGLVVVASGGPWDVATGLHLVAPLPCARAMVTCTSDAVAIGAQLVASNTPGRARPRQPGDTGAVIGVAQGNKAAGAEGLIPIGPA